MPGSNNGSAYVDGSHLLGALSLTTTDRADNVIGSHFGDTLDLGNGNDTACGNNGHDTLRGGLGDDSLAGGWGKDLLGGSWGDDSLDGGGGNDRLWGGAGSDTLLGGSGWDRLDGGAGDDLLSGGTGRDALTGGLGSDVFQISAISGATFATITDFDPAHDTIALAASAFGLAAGPLPSGALLMTWAAGTSWISPPSAYAATRLIYDLAGGTLSFDSDGSGPQSAVEIAHLAPHLKLTAADFVVV